MKRTDAVGKEGIHLRIRIFATLCMLTYERAAEMLDDYLQVPEGSVLLSPRRFRKKVFEKFGKVYKMALTEVDIWRIIRFSAMQGFNGCQESIDCQHWDWKLRTVSWAEQIKERARSRVILVATSDGKLCVWPYFFDNVGRLNDINVMDQSTTMSLIFTGKVSPDVHLIVNGNESFLPYFLSKHIKPNWRIFV